jgi:hypothetical protein
MNSRGQDDCTLYKIVQKPTKYLYFVGFFGVFVEIEPPLDDEQPL